MESFQTLTEPWAALALLVLGHFGYSLSRRPSKIQQLFENKLRSSYDDYGYIILLYFSWVVFVFNGAHSLLSWLPDDYPIWLSLLLVLVSFKLLGFVQNSINTKLANERLRHLSKQVEHLVRANIHQLEFENDKTNLQEAGISAQATADEINTYIERFSGFLAYRDWRNGYTAVTQAILSNEVQLVNHKQPVVNIDAQAEKNRRLRLKKIIEKDFTQLPPVALAMEGLYRDEEYLLPNPQCEKAWQLLENFSADLKQYGSEPSILENIDFVLGTIPLAGVSFQFIHNGNTIDGYYEILTYDAEGKTIGSLADGLVFFDDLDGMVAAFFMRVQLTGSLAWGKGLQGRDDQAVLSNKRLLEILVASQVQADWIGLKYLTHPPGLRIRQLIDCWKISCLVFRPGLGIFDCTVTLKNGVASERQTKQLFAWGQGIVY